MSRRGQIQLSEQEIESFIRSSQTIILCSSGPGGFPHPMPMWFVFDGDGTLRMTTYKASQKVKNIRRDPRVSLLIESGKTYSELKGVVIYSNAEIIDDLDSVIDTLLAAAGTRPGDPAQLEALRESVKKRASKRVVIRVKPERIVSWDHSKLSGGY